MAFQKKALQLISGSSQYASISTAVINPLSDYTIEFNVRLTEEIGSGIYELFHLENNTAKHVIYVKYEYNSGTRRLVFQQDKWLVVGYSTSYNIALGAKKNYHIAVRMSSRVMQILVDGVEVGTPFTFVSGDYSTGDTTTNNETIVGAGCTVGTGTKGNFSKSIISNVKVWNTARSTSDILNNKFKLLVGNETNLVASWELNDYEDQTSNNYDLTASGSPMLIPDVPFSTVNSSDWTQSKKLYVPTAKVTGSSNHTNFPILIKDTVLPTAIFSDLQTGEANDSWLMDDDALLAYYRGTASDLTLDSTGNGYSLTNNGTVVTSTEIFGHGFDMGTSNTSKKMTRTGNFSGLDLTKAFTLSCRVVINSAPGSGVVYRLLDLRSTVGAGRYMLLRYQNNGGTLRLIPLFSSGTDPVYNIDLGTATEFSIALSSDDAGVTKIWVNGELVATGTRGTDSIATGGIAIGGKFDEAVEYSNAVVGDVIVLNRELSAEEFKRLHTGGADLRITTDSAGVTEVPFEIVNLDIPNTLAEIWLKIPTLYYNQNTDFYVWAGNNRATPYNKGSFFGQYKVWEDYLPVYHFEGLLDANINNFDLSNTNSVAFNASSLGKGADAGSSNSDKLLSISNNLGINGGIIDIMLLIKLNAEISSGTWIFTSQQNISSDVQYAICYEYNGGTRRLVFRRYRQGVAADEIYFNITLGTSNTHLLRLTYDNTNLRGYCDGVLVVGPTAFSGSGSGTSSDHLSMLAEKGGSGTAANFSSSIIPEARVQSVVRSTDWNETEYTMFNDPATFIEESGTQLLGNMFLVF